MRKCDGKTQAVCLSPEELPEGLDGKLGARLTRRILNLAHTLPPALCK